MAICFNGRYYFNNDLFIIQKNMKSAIISISLFCILAYTYEQIRVEKDKYHERQLLFKIDSLKCQKSCICKSEFDSISDAEAIRFIKKNKPKFLKHL